METEKTKDEFWLEYADLSDYTLAVGGPTSLGHSLTAVVDTKSFSRFFEAVYEVYSERIYNTDKGSDRIELGKPVKLPQDRFVLLCRYLLLTRVKRVFREWMIRRMEDGEESDQIRKDRIKDEVYNKHELGFSAAYYVGEPLATVIDNVGTVILHSRGLTIVPEPETDDYLWSSALNRDDVSLFEQWMFHLRNCAYLRGSYLSDDIAGTAFWTLQACKPGGKRGTLKCNELIVRACHRDWSAEDGFQCLMTASRVSPLVSNEAHFYSSGRVRYPFKEAKKWTIAHMDY